MRARVLLLSLAMVGAASTSGCALVGDPCRAPVTGTASYVSGSTPPPYHYAWSVRLEESSGTVTWSPGYGAPETWAAEFSADAARVEQACRGLRAETDRDTAPGGGTLTVRWAGAGGRVTRLTTSDDGAADLVRAAVPPDAWARARSGFEAWQQAQRR